MLSLRHASAQKMKGQKEKFENVKYWNRSSERQVLTVAKLQSFKVSHIVRRSLKVVKCDSKTIQFETLKLCNFESFGMFETWKFETSGTLFFTSFRYIHIIQVRDTSVSQTNYLFILTNSYLLRLDLVKIQFRLTIL